MRDGVPDAVDRGRRPRRPDAPASAQLIARATRRAVRAPEQGTRPKLFYTGADAARRSTRCAAIACRRHLPLGRARRPAAADGRRRPAVGDDVAGAPAYNTAHPRPWGWRVAAYLWTKAIARRRAPASPRSPSLLGSRWTARGATSSPPVVGAACRGADRRSCSSGPEAPRPLPLPAHPAELALVAGAGAVVPVASTALLTVAWFVAGIARHASGRCRRCVPGRAAAAACAAGYTAFLFGQAEGRDLWQTRCCCPTCWHRR